MKMTTQEKFTKQFYQLFIFFLMIFLISIPNGFSDDVVEMDQPCQVKDFFLKKKSQTKK